MASLDLWTGGAVLISLATLCWGVLLLRRIHERFDRLLVGLVGLVAAYQGLHLVIEPHGWAWFANAIGVSLSLGAMSMLRSLARERRHAQFALRLSEARERPLHVATRLEPSMLAAPARVPIDVPRTILDAAPMAMFAVSLDGSVNFWNAAAERLLGWSREEVLGHRMPDLISHTPSEMFDGGPIRLVRKDGAPIQGPVQSVPVRDAQGAVSGILTIVTPASI